MNPFILAGIGWAFMALMMLILFGIQRRTKNAGIVDVGWSFGVGALAVFFAVMADGDPLRRIVLAILAGIWSFRLGYFLLIDRVIGRPEDGRYVMLRERWGDHADRNLFLFFQVQAFWAVMFAVPFLAVVYNAAETPSWFDVVGVLIWIVAILGESVADMQLARFKRQPESRGKTCRSGLWGYSRHPNYFFEWIHWFAYVFLAIHSSGFWVALAGPVVMLFFLYKVTGIPYTEKQALKSRGEDYRRYQETTSAFIPWFPKKG